MLFAESVDFFNESWPITFFLLSILKFETVGVLVINGNATICLNICGCTAYLLTNSRNLINLNHYKKQFNTDFKGNIFYWNFAFFVINKKECDNLFFVINKKNYLKKISGVIKKLILKNCI